MADLIGRDDATARLDAVLDHLRAGGGALVVRGEAGIGKSALLDHARGRASVLGARTLATVGVESEAELGFAGLHQLLHPVSGRSESLPDALRRALDGAFGGDDALEPDSFRVALAAYRLVSEAADSSPLILIADDAQWLDHASLDVLTFIARRLEGEPLQHSPRLPAAACSRRPQETRWRSSSSATERPSPRKKTRGSTLRPQR